tara:strand:- start:589 stop:1074 length:486 start_codon:yes stop_codon:yes gene_type:complete
MIEMLNSFFYKEINKIRIPFLLIFLLLQGCSDSRFGNILESTFEDNSKTNLIVSEEIKDKDKIIKNNTKKNKSINQDNLSLHQNENIVKKNALKNNIKKTPSTYNINKDFDFISQDYRITIILKNVNPKSPIEEFSGLLRKSKLDFEIERIELYNKFIKSK